MTIDQRKRWFDGELILEVNEAIYVGAAILLVGVLFGWAVAGSFPHTVPVQCVEGLEAIGAY